MIMVDLLHFCHLENCLHNLHMDLDPPRWRHYLYKSPSLKFRKLPTLPLKFSLRKNVQWLLGVIIDFTWLFHIEFSISNVVIGFNTNFMFLSWKNKCFLTHNGARLYLYRQECLRRICITFIGITSHHGITIKSTRKIWGKVWVTEWKYYQSMLLCIGVDVV